MTTELAQRFFNEMLPAIFAAGPDRGDSLRCRFYVGGAGAWEVDLRFPQSKVTTIYGKIELAGANAALEFSSDVFARVLASQGNDVLRLVSTGDIRVFGDTMRGIETLSVLVKAPPFAWPASLRVLPVDSAFMSATVEELAEAFSGWRRPLAAPIVRMTVNPFTGEQEPLEIWDPQPEVSVNGSPLEPVVPFVCFRPKAYWWEDLLDFYLWLVPDDVSARSIRDEAEDVALALNRVFPDALYGGENVLSVLTIPERFTTAASRLTDDAIAMVDPNGPFAGWENPHPGYQLVVRGLHELRNLATSSLRDGRRLWFWGRYN
jgi:hypothetical protein